MSRFLSGRDLKFQSDEIKLTGSTLTGALNSTATPAVAGDLVTKTYVDTAVSTLPFAGNSLTDLYQGGQNGASCSGSWTVPANVTNIFVQIWGGGGGGSMNCNWKAAAPGGGGGYSHRSIAVSGGQVFCYCAGGGGTCGRNYPGAKQACTGCPSRFCGNGVCMIACGGCAGPCSGTLYGSRACGGLSSGGDINIPGGDGFQFACCAVSVTKCQPSCCYSATIVAGGTFMGAPTNFRFTMCCSDPQDAFPFGGGGQGGAAGPYSNSCTPGKHGGGGAVLIWY